MIGRLCNYCCKTVTRAFHTSPKRLSERENPISRTFRILREDLTRKKKSVVNRSDELTNLFPSHADIVIIGGGAVGSSVAYWLKEKTNAHALRIVVLEKDPSYSKCSTTLSVGGLRQQFSLPENIHMSMFGAEFLRTLKKRFGPEAEVNFTPHGYMVLASEDGAQQLLDNSKLQRELGAVNTVLTRDDLKERFPWMNVDDVELGCLGLEKEGWFDPWSMLNVLRKGAQDLGTQYIHADVVDFTFHSRSDIMVEGIEGNYQAVNEVIVKLPNGERKSIHFAYCVLAAGCDSGEIAELAGIGLGNGMLSIPLPVEKRKRYVYNFNCPHMPPGINTPLTCDFSGMYFRRECLGGSFICGLSPPPEEEPLCDNMDVDHTYFDEKIWPLLANRVPAFEAVKVTGGWSGFYDYNRYDENGIIGAHPYYFNMYLATGFSGHGIQQAPAVGRAIAELILDGRFVTIDLTRLGFDRLIVDKPMYEQHII
ncbi:FAD-dependent oxidoreductase domain-containing protein 1 [Aethina tumida]|uniref:FAD-dependent oxidoreductase domain-containing protein 1 n=1 Tax=Aethina tumida TaxID=116153 RepID=UPI00096AF16D|nr:FAD-dependent oxidoreductase domain-containing protein 1 [Aethina tumida]